MKFIAAVDERWAIGNNGRLLDRISEDQKNFRRTTMGHVVVLGRKTLEEFPGGKPLSGRTNIILSTNTGYSVDGAVVVHSMEELFERLSEYDTDDVYVIGGQSVYRELIPYCDEAVITKLHRTYEADSYIANLDELPEWHITDERDGEEENSTAITFISYKNASPKKIG